LLDFGRVAVENRAERGLGKPGTFNFLGFVPHCGRTRSRKFTAVMRSERKRVSSKLKKLKERLTTNRSLLIEKIIGGLNFSLKGRYNYYRARTNAINVKRFRYMVEKVLFRALNGRNQSRGVTWEGFNKLPMKRPPALPRKLQNG
jgi:hypothetical protein